MTSVTIKVVAKTYRMLNITGVFSNHNYRVLVSIIFGKRSYFNEKS